MSDYTELVKELRESPANKRLMTYAAEGGVSMGFYIKGMKMPKDECVGIFVYPDGRVHVWRSMSLVGQEYMAVPVPDHGRLIDVDAFMQPRWIDGRNEFDAGVLWTIKKLGEAPTIIPAEEGE